jgi:hypothetical protein
MTKSSQDVPPSASAGPAPDPAREGRGTLRLTALFATILLASALARIPSTMRLDWFMFCDNGANLTEQVLIDRGERPTVDFGYQYGLLALFIGRAWLSVVGRTLWGYESMVVACNVLLIWGLARCARAVRAGPAGLTLLVITLPYSLNTGYVSFAHALEPVFLTSAFAEHARGRRAAALAWLTACCFIKPSVSYIYGFVLVVIILRQLVRDRAGPLDVARRLGPAAITGIALAALLAVYFGVEPVVRTVLPVTGAEAYKYANFGFFKGIGRDFWAPRGVTLKYYIGTVVGFWMLATFALLGAGLAALWAIARAPEDGDTPRRELVVSCALIHVGFVCLAFGNAWSWYYYFYVLVLGNVAAWGRGGARSAVAWVLAASILPCYFVSAREYSAQWRTQTPSRAPETAGLWASRAEWAEWDEVLKMIRGRKPVLLVSNGGCAELLYPDFAEPIGYFFLRGIALPGEIERKARQLAGASMVVMENSTMPHRTFLKHWPEFQAAMSGCELAHDGTYFAVYRRVAPPSADAPAGRD